MPIKKIGIVLLSVIGAVVIGGALFVKFDTPAAAVIADEYMRPFLGDKTVIYMEKAYFNSADTAQQAVSRYEAPSPPVINDLSPAPSKTSLALEPLPVNPAFPPLAGEGEWRNISLGAFPGREVMATAFVRPDPERNYSIVSIVKIDQKSLAIGSVAGIKEPGGKLGNPGPGKVPDDIVQSDSLVAAFDGGFQYHDGKYGMMAGGKTYVPLRDGLGAVVGYRDGSIRVLKYFSDLSLGDDVAFIRENGPMLIENGAITTHRVDSIEIWGAMAGDSIYTWRSGIGVDADGEALFAAGNGLSPQTLGEALKEAGAVNAVQLDINPFWVRFNIFNPLGGGKYDSFPLAKGMADGQISYLTGYSKDFFYVYKRQP